MPEDSGECQMVLLIWMHKIGGEGYSTRKSQEKTPRRIQDQQVADRERAIKRLKVAWGNYDVLL